MSSYCVTLCYRVPRLARGWTGQRLGLAEESGDASKVVGLGISATVPEPCEQEVVPLRKRRAHRSTDVNKALPDRVLEFASTGTVTVGLNVGKSEVLVDFRCSGRYESVGPAVSAGTVGLRWHLA